MDEGIRPTATAETACGGKLKDTRDFPSALYGEERIYFCSQACLQAFEQDPDAFMAGQHPKKEN